MPSITFGDRNGKRYELPTPMGQFYTRGGTGAYQYLQEDGTIRKTVIDDVKRIARLYERIEHIELMAAPFVHDVPEQCTDVHLVATMLKNSTKHHWIQPYKTGSIKKKAFGLNTHCLGYTTNSPCLDVQAGIERGIHSALFPLTDVDIMGSMGNFNVVRSTCPALIVIDNEMAGMCKKMREPIDFSDDGQAWDLLKNCNPGDTFIAEVHSAKHCRDFFLPTVFTNNDRERWESEGSKDILARAWEQYHALVKDDDGAPLITDDQLKEIDTLLQHAEKHIKAGDHSTH